MRGIAELLERPDRRAESTVSALKYQDFQLNLDPLVYKTVLQNLHGLRERLAHFSALSYRRPSGCIHNRVLRHASSRQGSDIERSFEGKTQKLLKRLLEPCSPVWVPRS